MRKLLLLLGLQGTAVAWAQADDAKSQVYVSYFNQKVFRCDATAQQVENVFIAPLNSSMRRLDLDTDYLRDYLDGTIGSNRAYREVVQPKGVDALSYLSAPQGLDRLLVSDQQAGRLLLRLDSALRAPHQLPAFVGSDKRFVPSTIVQPDWLKFQRQYPHCYGLTQVSDCVFSADGTRALFYFECSRGALNGWGGVIFMKRTARGWEEDTSLQFWIS